MSKEVDPCRGCVCSSCAKSEKNGNSYGCRSKRCRSCEKSDTVIKLACCDDHIEIEGKGELFTL